MTNILAKYTSSVSKNVNGFALLSMFLEKSKNSNLKALKCGILINKYLPLQNARGIFTTNMAAKTRDKQDRKSILSRVKPKEEGVEGENITSIDSTIRGFGDTFPDENTPNLLFDRVKFSDLPIVNVKVSKNNTIMSVTDSKGLVKLLRSCGMEGFKHAKKGTNIAAQAAAESLGKQAIDRGFKNVRVAVRGLGPGRVAAVKGLTMGGLNVVSLSDVSPVSFTIYPRPRKAKRS